MRMRSSPAIARISSSITKRPLLRAPMMIVTLLPAALSAWAMGCIGATPMPPPTQTTWPGGSPFAPRMDVGLPSGPSTAERASPTFSLESFSVVAPTVWKMSVIVPLSGLASAMVRGMRSPSWSSTMRMMNWPGLRSWAMRGASTSMRKTFSESCRFAMMRFMIASIPQMTF